MPTSPGLSAEQQAQWERRSILARELLQTPGGRLGWLLAFLREDPTGWLPEHAVLHGYRLDILANELELARFPPRVVVDVEQRSEPWTPARVRRFHRRLRTWIRTLVSDVSGNVKFCTHMVPVPLRGFTLSILRMTPPRQKPARFLLVYRGSQETILFHKLAEWIRETDRLVACRQCGEPCLALRKRLFCSSACLQQHHDRIKIEKRKREKKGDAR